jgi:hypothetical protein
MLGKYKNQGRSKSNWLDSVYETISHPGFWAIIMVILLLVSLITRYLYIILGIEVFRVINVDSSKVLSIIGIAFLSSILTRVFEE